MRVEQPVKAVESLDALEPDLRFRGTLLKNAPRERYIPRVPAPKKPDDRQFKFGNKIRVNLHHGKIEDAVVRAVIHDSDDLKLQVDIVGLDLTALIDTRHVSFLFASRSGALQSV